MARSARCAAALGLVAALGGCVSQQTGAEAHLGPTAAAVAEANAAAVASASVGGIPVQVATLGAGDALGRALYITDLMLAASQRLNEPAAPVERAPSRADIVRVLVEVPTP